jgi:hypothetical protein
MQMAVLLRTSVMYVNKISSGKRKVKDKAIPVTCLGGP